MSASEFKNAAKIIEKVAESMYDKEEFLLHPIANRVCNAAVEFPDDPTLIQMASFLKKKVDNKNFFITRAELKDAYKTLYSVNSRCSEYIPEAGIRTELPKIAQMTRDEKEGFIAEEAYNKYGNPILAKALGAAFEGKDASLDLYSKETAKKAVRNCSVELDCLGIKPKNVKVVAGQSDVLICRANYDTPKGVASILLPIEVVNEKPLFPTMFISHAGIEDLSKETVERHVVSSAGKSWKVDVNKVLKVVSGVKNKEVEKVSEVESIVAKLAADRGEPSYSPNGYLYQKVDDDISWELPESEDTQKFAEKLASVHGMAEFAFGKNTVSASKNLLLRALNDFGYKGAQVSVSDAKDDVMLMSVAINGSDGITVPVTIDNKAPVLPKVVFASGTPYAFNAKGISDALASHDYKAAAKASGLYGSNAAELIEVVKDAINSQDHSRIESALNVLSDIDETAFKYAFNLYNEALSSKGTVKQASNNPGCSLQIKHKHSSHIICGHTNLPIHKVYQDKYGNCLPNYTKNVKHTNEGGAFMTSKVFI